MQSIDLKMNCIRKQLEIISSSVEMPKDTSGHKEALTQKKKKQIIMKKKKTFSH